MSTTTDWTIVTPFLGESDSRARRLSGALAAAGRRVKVLSTQTSAQAGSSGTVARIQRRFLRYVRAWQVIRRARGVLVAVNAEFALLAWLARRLGLARGVGALVLDVYDHHGHIARGAVARVFAVLERMAVHTADAVIIPIEARLAQYEPPLPAHVTPRLHFISNLGFQAGRAAVLPEGKRTGQIVVVYAGTIDTGRGLPQLAEAGGRSAGEIEVRIYGTGPLEAAYRADDEFARCYHGSFGVADLPALYADADLICGFYELSVPNHRFCDPNKLREVFEFGRPMLTNCDTPLAEQVRRLGVGYVLDEVTPAAILRAARAARRDAAALIHCIEDGRPALVGAVAANQAEFQRLLRHVDRAAAA